MENVTLTPKEQARLQVLNSLMAEHMTLDQAATLMGVSPRHTRRILAAYRERGGRRCCSRAPWSQAAQRNTPGRGDRRSSPGSYQVGWDQHTHLGELLSEREGIVIGRTTLRRILVKAGLSSPR